MSDHIDDPAPPPMTTCEVFEWLLGKDAAGEIALAPQTRHTFKRFLETDREMER